MGAGHGSLLPRGVKVVGFIGFLPQLMILRWGEEEGATWDTAARGIEVVEFIGCPPPRRVEVVRFIGPSPSPWSG